MNRIRALVATLPAFTALVANAEFTGDGTAYTLGQPSAGNCNFMTWPKVAEANYAAINNDQWDNSLTCGRCAEVECIDERCTSNAKEVVHIMDRCPECKKGDLDLSPTVFKKVTGLDPHRLRIKWRFVDCPVQGPVQLCMKKGSNSHWTAIQPANTVTGVKSMTINGKSGEMVPSAFYFKVENSYGIDLSKIYLSITSTTGQVLEDVVGLTEGQCITTKSQFSGDGSKPSPAPPATDPPAPYPSSAAPQPAPTPMPSPTTQAPQPYPSSSAPKPAPSPTPPPTTNPPEPEPTPSPTPRKPTDTPTTESPVDPYPAETPSSEPTSSPISPTPEPPTAPTPSPSHRRCRPKRRDHRQHGMEKEAVEQAQNPSSYSFKAISNEETSEAKDTNEPTALTSHSVSFAAKRDSGSNNDNSSSGSTILAAVLAGCGCVGAALAFGMLYKRKSAKNLDDDVMLEVSAADLTPANLSHQRMSYCSGAQARIAIL